VGDTGAAGAMNVGVLASGAGTNLQALIDRAHGVDGVVIRAVGSDKPQAFALERARSAGIETAVFPRESYVGREARDTAIAAWLREREVELVVLAGYMQLLSGEFLTTFPDRVINVHPSLLPAFPGLDAVQQAIDYGVSVFGVSVFFVDGGVDSGPLILQRAIELPGIDDPALVLEHLHPVEHDLLVESVRLIARGAVGFDPVNPRRVVISR
jgi:phosphoribosylglycinamide formyltransferase-1